MPNPTKPAAAFEDKPRPAIALIPVESNKIKAIGYDAPTKTLAVAFSRGAGAIYHYPNVEPGQHAAFLAAESIGKHFGEHFQDAPFLKYPAEEEAAAAPD